MKKQKKQNQNQDSANNKKHKIEGSVVKNPQETMPPDINLLVKAIELDSIYFNKIGLTHLRSGQYQEAVDSFIKATELAPTNAAYSAKLGDAYYLSGKCQEAVIPLIKATELAPTNAAYSAKLGQAYYLLGRYQEAIVSLIKATELAPTTAVGFNNLGIAYDVLGKHREAIGSMQKAVKIEPENLTYRLSLGDMVMSYTKTTHIEQYKLTMIAMLNYANAGDNGFNRIIKFCSKLDFQIANTTHPKYPFLQVFASAQESSDEQAIKKAALPALETVVYESFKRGNYITVLEAVEKLLEIQQPKILDIFVTAEMTVKEILTSSNSSVDLKNIVEILFKQISLSSKVKLGNGQDQKNITDFLKYKMQEYHLKATSLIPTYFKIVLNTLKAYNIHEKGMLDEILSFLITEETVKSIEEPGKILQLLEHTSYFFNEQEIEAVGQLEDNAL